MSREREFKRIRRDRRVAYPLPDCSDVEELVSLLSDLVIDRVARLTHQSVVVIPVALPRARGHAPALARPRHPLCMAHGESHFCEEAWRAHLVELDSHPDSHWHWCEHGNLCAVVPIVWEGRCLAACQLVCAPSTSKEDFEIRAELLAMLVDSIVANEGTLLSQLARRTAAPPQAASGGRRTRKQRAHPQVNRALKYIHRHLSDREMTVAGIARDIGVNATYLAHLFSGQLGIRMSRYILNQRIELARDLLAETDWQIKRVAYESGHASADWFSHVFQSQTGLTPSEYRRRARVS